MNKPAHKNATRAPLRPLDGPTLALSCAGLGFLRPAPGTWGSVPPCALAALVVLLFPHPLVFAAVIGGVLLASSALCVALGNFAEARFGRKDAPEVVIDETAGQALALLALTPFLGMLGPGAGSHGGLVTPSRLLVIAVAIGAAFVLFRIFDILKPPPARRLEALPAGWGVLADDLAAGVYAGGCLLAVGFLLQ